MNPQLLKEIETSIPSSVLNDIQTNHRDLGTLIEELDWPQARIRLQSHPHECKHIDPITGKTHLHNLCSTTHAPNDIFEKVVEAYPDAVRIQDKKHKLTPLHIVCYTSQRSIRRVEILLKHMKPPDLLIRNAFGGTALHSACASNAWIPVIKLLVEANPQIVLIRTTEYNHTAMTALWHCHLQSIPGHMAIARILEGDVVDSRHFNRFWEKVEYLACQSFLLSPLCPAKGGVLDNDGNDNDVKNYMIHGLFHLRAPLNIFRVALRLNPDWAKYSDVNGNLALHHAVIRRPFRIKDIDLITDLLNAYPEAVGMKNKNGELPLFIAIRDRMDWDEGLGSIVQANTDVLSLYDKESGLYPFLLSASIGGNVAVNTTYQLLILKPYLIQDALL